ncbi:heavy metal translocating P-type ATPase, partial [Xanthomonas citri pv. citri]|nr:heavy metal translocating P-type ATPase [Xanthomonas citri pv. citri]
GASRSAFVDETAPDQAADVLLTLAAAVERGSEHPIARAIVAGAEERGLTVPGVADFASTAGGGVSGLVALPHDDGALGSGAHGAAGPDPVRVAVGRGSVLETALDGGILAEHRAAFEAAEQAGAT